ncbi:MAG: hypothetical protein N2C14_33610 [Planctomycetales bacterium]
MSLRIPALLLAFLFASLVDAAETDALRAVVPAGAGVYFETQDLSGARDEFVNSAFFERLRAFPPLKTWRRKNALSLQIISGQLAQRIGVEIEDLGRQVFGGNAALAVWPPKTSDPENVPWLLVVQARDAELLKKAVAGLNDATRQGKEFVSIREAAHADVGYHVRVLNRSGKESTEYLAAAGTFGFLTNQESLLKTALELKSSPARAEGRLLGNARFREAMSRNPSGQAARLFVDPRA